MKLTIEQLLALGGLFLGAEKRAQAEESDMERSEAAPPTGVKEIAGAAPVPKLSPADSTAAMTALMARLAANRQAMPMKSADMKYLLPAVLAGGVIGSLKGTKPA